MIVNTWFIFCFLAYSRVMDDPTKLSKPWRKLAPEPVSLPEVVDGLEVVDRHGNRTDALKGLWQPCSAFYVCSGPSLNNVDISRVAERGVLSLGVNNAAAYVQCSAFVCADPVEKFHQAIWFDGKILKFVPTAKFKKRVRSKVDGEFNWTPFRVRDCPNVWGFQRKTYWEPDSFFTNPIASWGCSDKQVEQQGKPKCVFTFFCGLRLLHYLGVKRVYLLGVDFAMQGGGRKLGNYAFEQTGGGDGNNEHYRAAVVLLEELVPVFEREQFEVLNCNADSHLRLFPYVPFDEALRDCKGGVPDVIDLSGFYEKAADIVEDWRG